MRPPRFVLFFSLMVGCSAPTPSPSPSAGASPQAAPGGATGTAVAEFPLPDPLPEIVARIDGEPIYLRQIVPMARARLDKAQDQDKEKPRILRQALREYIDRELLLKAALAQGTQADTRMVQQLYDAARADFPDEENWKAHLYWRGFDPQTFKAELRAQQTIDVFLARASGAKDALDVEEVAERRTETARALLERLRTKSRIETYL